MSWNGYEWNNLLRNEGCDADGNPVFTDVAKAVGADDQLDARGVAIADLDNDGDLDLVINHCPGDRVPEERARPTVLLNQVGNKRHWLAVELTGSESNRDAVGAMVAIRTGDRRQVQRVSAGSGYASQHSARLYFGLGDATRVDELTVTWPTGKVDERGAVDADGLVRITEGGGMDTGPLPGAPPPPTALTARRGAPAQADRAAP